MRNISTLRKKTAYALLLILIVMVPTAHVRAQAATQPANDQVIKLDYAIPGSKPDTKSQAMVVLPPDYHKPEAANKRWPVVYLLHGYSDNYEKWYNMAKGSDRALELMTARFGIILVMPDGKYNSWYFDASPDAPESADWQWETVITKHLVPTIDQRFRTWAEPVGRGIAGLSMGGHGAIFLCARHPELFSACGSMSGVMDIRQNKDNYGLSKLLGPYESNAQQWFDHSVIGNVSRFVNREVGIMIECGVRDKAFIEGNREMHRKLLELQVPHDYIERPGGHRWPIWINALPYQLQFMHDRLKPAGMDDKATN